MAAVEGEQAAMAAVEEEPAVMAARAGSSLQDPRTARICRSRVSIS